MILKGRSERREPRGNFSPFLEEQIHLGERDFAYRQVIANGLSWFSNEIKCTMLDVKGGSIIGIDYTFRSKPFTAQTDDIYDRLGFHFTGQCHSACSGKGSFLGSICFCGVVSVLFSGFHPIPYPVISETDGAPSARGYPSFERDFHSSKRNSGHYENGNVQYHGWH